MKFKLRGKKVADLPRGRRRLFGALALGLVGYLVNLAPVEIFPGVHLVFGSVCSIAAAVLCGPVGGGAAGFMSGLRLWSLWQQPVPVSALLHLLEGVWVGRSSRSGREQGILTSTLLFWLLVGNWVHGGLLYWLMKSSISTVLMTVTRGFVNALLAGLVVEVGRAAAAILKSRLGDEPKMPEVRLATILTLLLMTSITLPVLFILVRDGREVRARLLVELRGQAAKDVASVRDEVATLLTNYQRGVATVSAMAGEQGVKDTASLQRALAAVRSQYPEFAGMYVADATATTVAFDPPVNEAGRRLTGLKYDDREYYPKLLRRNTAVFSGVHRGGGGMNAPAVAIGVPFLSRKGEFNGFTLGWFDVNGLNHLLESHRQPGVEVVIVDAEGRLIGSSSLSAGEYKEVTSVAASREYRQAQAGASGEAFLSVSQDRGADALRFDPVLREGEHFAYATVPQAGWKIWQRQSLAPVRSQVLATYLSNLSFLAVILVLAHLLSKSVSRALTLPLVALEREAMAVAAGNLAARAWPRGLLTAEMGSLFLSFNRMARSLNASIQELRRSEERFRSAFDNAAVGMALVETGGQIREVNAALGWIVGYSESEVLQMKIQSLTYHDDLPGVLKQVKRLADGRARSFQREIRCRHKSGHLVWVSLNGSLARGSGDQEVRLIVQAQDITDRKRAEEQLLYDAFHDALTGLPNRALFLDRLRLAFERSRRRPEYRFAVLFLNLDRFKMLNDSLGHHAGDQLLVEAAERLIAGLRSGDTVARLGGDEFTVLLEEVDGVSEAKEIAARLQEDMARPFTVKEQEVFTSSCIGIAMGGLSYQGPEELLRDADTALSRAKLKGPGRVTVFDESMHAQAVDRLQLETDLRHALEREEFELHFQPIVELATGRLAGFEALTRWRHPCHGLVSPLNFIPVAEETGLIIPLGEWVLRRSCQVMRRWLEQARPGDGLKISVNLSGRQFTQCGLAERVRKILDETGLPAQHLKLEITESVVMENVESAVDTLRQVCALGVEVSLDDFGTGYSSLSYLHKFPITTLKIDRSFVQKMEDGGENAEIVRTILTLARTLRMEVIAEGVETAEQAARLAALDCQFCQGFFYSRPLDEEAAGALLAHGRRWEPPLREDGVAEFCAGAAATEAKLSM